MPKTDIQIKKEAAYAKRLKEIRAIEEPFKVKAKGTPEKWVGYYGLVRRRGGDVFEIQNGKEFSDIWMVKVGDDVPVSPPASMKKFGNGQKVSEEVPEEVPVTDSDKGAEGGEGVI